jgi:hypothetical protein
LSSGTVKFAVVEVNTEDPPAVMVLVAVDAIIIFEANKEVVDEYATPGVCEYPTPIFVAVVPSAVFNDALDPNILTWKGTLNCATAAVLDPVNVPVSVEHAITATSGIPVNVLVFNVVPDPFIV